MSKRTWWILIWALVLAAVTACEGGSVSGSRERCSHQKVWVKSPGDETTSVEVSPGRPATLNGVAVGDADKFGVKFQALDEKAEGVSYELGYQLR